MVICLNRGADLHVAQQMPLPLTFCCFSKIQIGLPFWYRLTLVVLDKRPLNACVCVSVGRNYPGQPVLEETRTHTRPDHQTCFIVFFHLLRSIASSLFNLHVCQSLSTTFLQVLFGLPLCLDLSTSYCIIHNAAIYEYYC